MHTRRVPRPAPHRPWFDRAGDFFGTNMQVPFVQTRTARERGGPRGAAATAAAPLGPGHHSLSLSLSSSLSPPTCAEQRPRRRRRHSCGAAERSCHAGRTSHAAALLSTGFGLEPGRTPSARPARTREHRSPRDTADLRRATATTTPRPRTRPPSPLIRTHRAARDSVAAAAGFPNGSGPTAGIGGRRQDSGDASLRKASRRRCIAGRPGSRPALSAGCKAPPDGEAPAADRHLPPGCVGGPGSGVALPEETTGARRFI